MQIIVLLLQNMVTMELDKGQFILKEISTMPLVVVDDVTAR